MNRYQLFILLVFIILPVNNGFSQVTGVPLPNWFSKIENYNRINCAIGVSYSIADTAKAIEQAKINALLNYSLLHHASSTSLTTVGMGDQLQETGQTSAIEYIVHTAIIKGKLPPMSSIHVKDKYFTAYKEAIVLLDIDNEPDDDTICPKFTIIRRTGFQKENNRFPLFIDEIEIEVSQNDSVLFTNLITKDGSRFYAKYGDSKITGTNQSKSMCYYAESANFDAKQSEAPVMPAMLNDGLWNAYFFNLVDQISIYNGLDINLQFKLSSSNTGNLSAINQILCFQQLVYSLKNIQQKKLHNPLANIGISRNCLYLAIQSKDISNLDEIFASNPNKADKKKLKKLKAEGWEYLGNEQYESVWMKSHQLLIQNDNYLFTNVEIQANNLQSGIIEGIQLAKLQLSSQLGSKITSLNNSEIKDENQVSVKSAKLINVEKTGSIGPYFIFYQKLAANVYNFNMIVFYNLQQINDLK